MLTEFENSFVFKLSQTTTATAAAAHDHSGDDQSTKTVIRS